MGWRSFGDGADLGILDLANIQDRASRKVQLGLEPCARAYIEVLMVRLVHHFFPSLIQSFVRSYVTSHKHLFHKTLHGADDIYCRRTNC